MCSHFTVTRSWKLLWFPRFHRCSVPPVDGLPYCSSHVPAPLAAGLRRLHQRGQALAEAGFCVVLFVLLSAGAVDFGYSFFALHTIAHATSAGARIASAYQLNGRGPCGTYSSPATATSAVDSFIRGQVGGIATINSVSVVECDGNICPASTDTANCGNTGSTIPQVVVTVQGTLPVLTGMFGSGPRSFTRVQTFRDEGR